MPLSWSFAVAEIFSVIVLEPSRSVAALPPDDTEVVELLPTTAT
jgi:hypothetical protein